MGRSKDKPVVQSKGGHWASDHQYAINAWSKSGSSKLKIVSTVFAGRLKDHFIQILDQR